MIFLDHLVAPGRGELRTTAIHASPGLSFFRLPFFCCTQLVTAFLLLLAFPPLEAAGVLQR
jgi:cytochrome c oxidase subunit 1